jgi:hypothetical protein
MKKFVNMTPHAIVINDGRVYEPSGFVVRVDSSYSTVVDDVCSVEFGDIVVIDSTKSVVEFDFDTDATYIVSGLCVVPCRAKGVNAVAPATGHPQAVRNEKGQIVSVPCFTI